MIIFFAALIIFSFVYIDSKLAIICSAVIFLTVSIVFSIVSSTRISKPFQRLVKNIQSLSGNRIPGPLPEMETREFDEINKSVNQLHASLESALKHRSQSELKIQKIKNEFEIQGRERTASLKKEIQDRALLEEKYRKVTEASPVPIILFDMSGEPIFINRAFTSTFGWNLEEFTNQKNAYIPEEFYEQNLKIRRKIVKGVGGRGYESQRYDKDGHRVDVSISFDVWQGANDRPAGCVVILHDVTESKRMERQLFQSQKMEAMGTLASGIAHDFNNILSGIFAFSQLADRHAGEADKARKHIGYIVKGAQRAAALVQQILTFCRQAEYQKQHLDLDIVVKEAVKLLESTIPSTIWIKTDISTGLTIMADPTQIHQVIMNLCTNAYHAMMETGGTLSILLERHAVTPSGPQPEFNLEPGNYARLEVRDTGCGMTKEIMEKAFDPYFTTKEMGKGTGVGLALVKAIVDAHQGRINVSSSPGEGAVFNVFIPAADLPATEKENPESVPDITGGTEHIMVVDDEESIRLAISEFLEDYGYTVSTFPDGESAFSAFEQAPERFDLIFTDVTMPGISGDALALKMLSKRPDLPIILCTGYSEKAIETKALESGVRAFIQKPISNHELDRLLRSALDA